MVFPVPQCHFSPPRLKTSDIAVQPKRHTVTHAATRRAGTRDNHKNEPTINTTSYDN